MCLSVLVGRDIEAVHCIIHYEAGHVTLTPVAGALCYINNVHICEPTKLGQGWFVLHLFYLNLLFCCIVCVFA